MILTPSGSLTPRINPVGGPVIQREASDLQVPRNVEVSSRPLALQCAESITMAKLCQDKRG
jgi:hypothetical protein